jgi:hypothetical protein
VHRDHGRGRDHGLCLGLGLLASRRVAVHVTYLPAR